ncbi:MAG: PAS domain-containing protein [Pseudomonadota bacterium]
MTQPKKHYLEAELEELLQSDISIWSFLREGSLDGVWYWDLENPDHEYMSPEFWRTFGYDPATKKHLVSEWMDLIFPDDLELAKENLGAHIADPAHPYDQVVRYTRADGETAWVRCRGLAVRDADGKAIRLLGAHNDITAQKREERALERAKTELETVFQAATSGIVAFNHAGEIARINNRARHMLGGISDVPPFAWPEAIEFLDAETMTPLDNSADPVRRALSGNRLQSETHLMRRVQQGDERRYVRVDTAVIEEPDMDLQLVLVIDDVSNEERNRQVVERKNRLDALGQLTGGIAHDFNNILASQLYAVDLARKATDPQKRDAYLEIAANSIKRGRSLTTRLLAFARRQPGLATVKRTADALEEFSTLVRPMLEEQIEVEFNIEDDDLRHYCDPAQLETALMNLVLNCRDAILRSGSGSHIDVRARAVRSQPDDPIGQTDVLEQKKSGTSPRFVEISVTDNGPGMDEETQARCTDPFFTTKETNSGTGLGLAMVYGFVRQSDGDLRIYSEEGVGTTVRMLLPRGTSEGAREAPMPEEAIEMGGGETLLVVEDELQLLVMISDVLTGLGYEVLSARSGQEALSLVESGEAFDLLLTDVVMPGTIGGFDLARRVREIRPEVPVIYTSGYTGFTATEMGAVQAPLLQKPAPPNELADAIKIALRGR